MKKPILACSAALLFLAAGGVSVAQQQQQQQDAGEGQCVIAQATLCYTDANDKRTCQTEKVMGDCETVGGGEGGGGDPGGEPGGDPGGPTP